MSQEAITNALGQLIDESIENGDTSREAAQYVLGSDWFKNYITDIMADSYHPEFGSEWMPPYGDQPAGSLYRHTTSVAKHAWNEGYYAGHNDGKDNKPANPTDTTPWKDN